MLQNMAEIPLHRTGLTYCLVALIINLQVFYVPISTVVTKLKLGRYKIAVDSLTMEMSCPPRTIATMAPVYGM